jgi:hypothetical protein
VCISLGATNETVESSGENFGIFKVMISDAPSKLEFICHSIPGKCLKFVP